MPAVPMAIRRHCCVQVRSPIRSGTCSTLLSTAAAKKTLSPSSCASIRYCRIFCPGSANLARHPRSGQKHDFPGRYYGNTGFLHSPRWIAPPRVNRPRQGFRRHRDIPCPVNSSRIRITVLHDQAIPASAGVEPARTPLSNRPTVSEPGNLRVRAAARRSTACPGGCN